MVLKVMSLTSCWTDENVAGTSERYSEKFLKGFRTPENFRVVWSGCLRGSWTYIMWLAFLETEKTEKLKTQKPKKPKNP